MAKQKKKKGSPSSQKLKRDLLLISVTFLVAKLALIFIIKFGGWLGSDAEGYIKGAAALLKDGFFSKQDVLSYLPAGYPILIWILSLITGTAAFITQASSLVIISIFQTLVYFVACAFFVEKIRATRLRTLALPTAVLLGINPTLSLSSLVVGYESLVASCMLLSVALVIDYQTKTKQKSLVRTLILVGLLQSLAGIMQPRILLVGIGLIILWACFQQSRKSMAVVLLVGFGMTSVLPLALVFRNYQATGSAVLSTQLGITMSAGAGDKATGGFTGSLYIHCPPKSPPVVASDSDLVKCVLDWYRQHPTQTIRLIINKTIFFWSPWSGPLANGTMGRNPWLKMSPMRVIGSTPSRHGYIYGGLGLVISWIWLLAGLVLLFLGFGWLWKLGGLERQISLLMAVPIVLATLTSVGTIGDHRYRVPTMGLSLFLQVAGFFALKGRFPMVPTAPALEPKGRAR